MKRLAWAVRLGQVLQGMILGGLLYLAVIRLLLLEGGARIFRYQGF